MRRPFSDLQSWAIHDVHSYPAREANYGSIEEITCSAVRNHFHELPRLYSHQIEALQKFIEGENVCLATGTASGKTALFHGAHARLRAEQSGAKTLALYPMKALGYEQELRWRKAFPDQIVGRIDGDIQGMERERMLRTADILISTPDVWHSSLLGKLNDKSVSHFLSKLGLIALDEAHTYTGVFGSNSAFLLRRLQHAAAHFSQKLVGFVAASATLTNPKQHLFNLTGVEFYVIGAERDGSPKHPMLHHFIEPSSGSDLMKALPDLLGHLVSEGKRFLAFADSRKQVELLSDIVNRGQGLDYDDFIETDILTKFGVLPYRSGYEREDRDRIQSRLQDPNLSGVIATSAMELGLDIPNLDTVVLIGVPNSATSLHQRIGRVGRSKAGEVIIAYSGTIADQYVWGDTTRFLSRPLQESHLYLGNKRIQYIHAMCLARSGGENEVLTGRKEEPIQPDIVSWPEGFLELCEQERTGQIEGELDAMKGEAGDEPHRRYPLRSCESQFKITCNETSLGQVGYSQALREAYPGGIYRHLMDAYRVFRVSISSKQILVRKEKRYTSSPVALPVKVMPNVQAGRLRKTIQLGDAILLECDAQIREAISGFKERRGPNELTVSYPDLSQVTGATWPHPMFSHQYGSSALVIFHPLLDGERVECPAISKLLFEALMIAQPFERNDLGFAYGKLDVSYLSLKGKRFLAVYDSTNGSLRLSSRFLENSVIETALAILSDVAKDQELRPETRAALNALSNCSKVDRIDLLMPAVDVGDRFEVILPGSFGWSLPDGRQDFVVEGIFLHPKEGLKYRGHLRAWESSKDPQAKISLPITCVEIVPGESKTGFYNFETGEILN